MLGEIEGSASTLNDEIVSLQARIDDFPRAMQALIDNIEEAEEAVGEEGGSA